MNFSLGWYYINEWWNLYLDGNLTEVHVDFINVDEAARGEGFVVKHYDRGGQMLTSLRLDADDLEPELNSRTTTSRPLHI